MFTVIILDWYLSTMAKWLAGKTMQRDLQQWDLRLLLQRPCWRGLLCFF